MIKTFVKAPPPRPPVRRVKISDPPIKPCEKCKYFDKGSCTLFFSQNPVDGGLVYFDAKEARTDGNFCGPEAYFFKQDF